MRCHFAEMEVEEEDCEDGAGTDTGSTGLVLGGDNAQVCVAVSTGNEVMLLPKTCLLLYCFTDEVRELPLFLFWGGMRRLLYFLVTVGIFGGSTIVLVVSLYRDMTQL